MTHAEIYGGFAEIRIKFDGTLRQLSEILSNALNMKSFEVEISETPPYQEIGSAEVLGWEIWLKSELESSGWFVFRLETEHAVQEAYEHRMYDLSPWLARFIAMLCDLETGVV